MNNLRTRLHKSAKESTILSEEKNRMVDEVRMLYNERAQLIIEAAEERKRAEADRESVWPEMDELRQGVTKAREARDAVK